MIVEDNIEEYEDCQAGGENRMAKDGNTDIHNKWCKKKKKNLGNDDISFRDLADGRETLLKRWVKYKWC